jgi:hypothetical protein
MPVRASGSARMQVRGGMDGPTARWARHRPVTRSQCSRHVASVQVNRYDLGERSSRSL